MLYNATYTIHTVRTYHIPIPYMSEYICFLDHTYYILLGSYLDHRLFILQRLAVYVRVMFVLLVTCDTEGPGTQILDAYSCHN